MVYAYHHFSLSIEKLLYCYMDCRIVKVVNLPGKILGSKFCFERPTSFIARFYKVIKKL